MLQIKNLTISHRKDLRVILRDFSLTLQDGDKAVMIGEEGNGKSTLLKWIYDPALIEEYTESEGERIVNQERMGYLPQELSTEDRDKTVYEFFSEEPLFFSLNPKELSGYAGKFHLPADLFYSDLPMKDLSGGERVKVQMIRLLMAQPTVLLLDEPSNDIDLETLRWLEQFIAGFKGIVLYISHDETLIEQTATVVVHLEQIRRKTVSRYTVARVLYQQYVSERQNQFDKQKQQAVNDQREKRIREEKYQRIYQSVAYAQETISRQNPAGGRLLKKKMHAVKSMERRFERENEEMTQMPEQEEAIFFKLGGEEDRIPAGKTVLEYTLPELTTPDEKRILARNIFLRVKGSAKICIVGTNGIGKTTLLRKIAGELTARKDLAAAYMPQNYEELLEPDMTPVDYLDRSGRKEERTRIRTFLGALKYTADEMEHPISELSGGQKAKVLLLKMSLSGANVLVLDEPTRNFSPLSGPVIRKMLAEFPGAIISISHDRKYIDEVCDVVYRLTQDGLVQEFPI